MTKYELHNAGNTMRNGYYEFRVLGPADNNILKQFGFISIQLKFGGYLDVDDMTNHKDGIKKLKLHKCYCGWIFDVANLGYSVKIINPLIEIEYEDFVGIRTYTVPGEK